MAEAASKVGELVDGKYELESLLGQGGMGAVYRARHAVTGRRVAIKWLLEDDAERRRRFLREARAMGRLSHPNVAQIYDVSEHEGEIFLVMEYLEGSTLRDVIPAGGMSPDEAIGLLMPALSGVAAAHQAGILHRDLKPENLFVCRDRDGTPYDTKVLDFGLAKASEAQADSKLTNSGAIVGTPRYLAPEQLEEKELDERADVFALGLILYECLVGELPYRSQSLNALLLEILTADHAPPHTVKPEIPEELGLIVKRALEREPGTRFSTVIELAKALEPFSSVRFQAPREAHLTPRSDEPLMSNLRALKKTPAEPGPLATTASAKRKSTPEAFARTDAVSAEAVSRTSAEPPPPARAWLVPALVIAAGLVVAAVIASQLGHPDPAPRAPTAAPEPVATEPIAEPEPAADPVPTEPTPAAAEVPVEPVEPAPEAEAAPEAATPIAPPARRRRVEPPPTAADPAPTPEPSGEATGVNSRAGVFRADDF